MFKACWKANLLTYTFVFGITSLSSPSHALANPTDRKILLLGDSHTLGGFGDEIQKLMETTGLFSQTIASCGFNPKMYLDAARGGCGRIERFGQGGKITKKKAQFDSPELDFFLSDPAPLLTIVSLGSNDGGMTPETERRIAQKLVGKVLNVGSKCIWVGPPLRHAARFDRNTITRSNTLRDAANDAGCEFVSSYDLPGFARPVGNTDDSDHYDIAPARKRADLVWHRIIQTKVFTSLFPDYTPAGSLVARKPVDIYFPNFISGSGTLTTSSGAKFRKTETSPKVAKWQHLADGVGVGPIWTEVVGSLPNGHKTKGGAYCEISDDEKETRVIDDPEFSAAVGACAAIGARLPEVKDFTQLLKLLQPDYDGSGLKPHPLKDLRTLFPQATDASTLWTATVGPSYEDYAFVLDASTGDITNYSTRLKPELVVCVSP